MKMRRTFIAPQLAEEAALAKLTLGGTVVSGRAASS